MDTGPKTSNGSPDLAPLANLITNTNDQSTVSSSESSSMSQVKKKFTIFISVNYFYILCVKESGYSKALCFLS